MKIFYLILFLFFSFNSVSQTGSELALVFLSETVEINANYRHAYTLCSQEFQGEVEFKEFEETFVRIKEQLGNASEISQKCQKGTTIYVHARHSLVSIVWKVVLNDQENKIIGFFTLLSAPCEATHIETIENNFIRTPIIIETHSSSVNGVLTTPSKKSNYPLVALLQGSGSHEADYNIGEFQYFKSLADSLANKGIATLRLDKRTVNNSLLHHTLYDEQVEDMIKAINQITTTHRDSITNVLLLGHSLGIASMIPIMDSIVDIDALICLSGTTRDIFDVLIDQLESIDSYQDKESLIEKARFGRDSLSADAHSNQLPFDVRAEYWLSVESLQLEERYRNVEVPVLTIIGLDDFNLNSKDVFLWNSIADSNHNVKVVVLPDLDHFLFLLSDSGKSEKSFMAEKAFDLILDFIQKPTK